MEYYLNNSYEYLIAPPENAMSGAADCALFEEGSQYGSNLVNKHRFYMFTGRCSNASKYMPLNTFTKSMGGDDFSADFSE